MIKVEDNKVMLESEEDSELRIDFILIVKVLLNDKVIRSREELCNLMALALLNSGEIKELASKLKDNTFSEMFGDLL